MRGFLRTRYPDQAPGSGGRWLLTSDQVTEIRQYFGSGRSRQPSTATPKTASASLATDDWFWEGNVQAALIRDLVANGWRIISQADTGRHQRGHDVVAARSSRNLIVEVKGYPSKGYRDPRRAGEFKPTNPTLQAKHWFADALLKAVRTRAVEPDADVALCFPLAPRYESLLRETMPMLVSMKIAVFIVDEQGGVTRSGTP